MHTQLKAVFILFLLLLISAAAACTPAAGTAFEPIPTLAIPDGAAGGQGQSAPTPTTAPEGVSDQTNPEATATTIASPRPADSGGAEAATATATAATTITVVDTDVQYVQALTDVNVRRGPGTQYEAISWIADGQVALVTGTNSDGSWWRVICADDTVGDCWVTAGAQYTQPLGHSDPGPNPIPPTPSCTHAATFVADITVPDGSQVSPGAPFRKIWRLRNNGTCTWGEGYYIAHVGGNLLNASNTTLPIPGTVLPGATVDLVLDLVAPITLGEYESYWKLVDVNGQQFGVGAQNNPIWIKIDVAEIDPTVISGFVYYDVNANQVYDNGDTRLINREIHLLPGSSCEVSLTPVAAAISDNEGRYTFNGGFDGSYCLVLRKVSGLGYDDLAAVTVAHGEELANIHLRGAAVNATISGWVWHDYCQVSGSADAPQLEGNCVADGRGGYRANGQLESSETYIAGVTVRLQQGACATGNPDVLATAVTDASGRYIFSNLTPGTYCVFVSANEPVNQLLLPGQWTFPQVGIGYHQLTIQADEVVTPVNFGWDYLPG